MTPRFIVAISVVLLLTTLPLPAAAAKPDFSGIWKLDPEESDDPLQLMRDRLDKRPRIDSGVLPGDPTQPPIRRPTAPRRDPGNRGLREPDEGVERLDIVHADPRISIRFADGQERVFFTDNRAPVDRFEIGLLSATAKWKKRDLVFRAESAYGGKIRETYQLSADGSRLTVTIRREGDGHGPGIVFKRIYDRVEEWGPSIATPETKS
jgi:hypothetical protein